MNYGFLKRGKRKRKKPLTQKEVGLKYGFRSGLEKDVAKQLENLSIPYRYEEEVIEYQQPVKKRRYTPDFILPNGIIIETKGRFITADRQKHLLIKQQHPDKDIRFVFSNPNAKINKRSKTTYAMWCERNGFKYAAKRIPEAWLKENKKGVQNMGIKIREMSQVDCVLKYLSTGKSITPAKAKELFDVNRLSAIIYILKKRGFKIINNLEYDVNGKRYSRYYLAEYSDVNS